MELGTVVFENKIYNLDHMELDEIKALLKRIDESKKKEINETKVALSLKFPETNPWANAAEVYALGNEVTGKVARMTDFGAFVELAPGVDALLHVSQISRAHVEKPADVLKVGQAVEAKVVDFNAEDKKISLSMKALEPEAPAEEVVEEAVEAVEE